MTGFPSQRRARPQDYGHDPLCRSYYPDLLAHGSCRDCALIANVRADERATVLAEAGLTTTESAVRNGEYANSAARGVPDPEQGIEE